MYTYKPVNGEYVVGRYTSSGKWLPVKDCKSKSEARQLIEKLNRKLKNN